MIKVLQILCFGNIIVLTTLIVKSGWRWVLKSIWRDGILSQKAFISGKKKKISGFLAMCAYREASGQERKIEHPSHRTLFILLSPALNREVLSKCHDSEKNKFLLISFSFPISAFRSLRVSPDWEAASFSKSALQSWWCEEKEHHLPLCLPQWGNGYFADLWVGNAGSCFMA